MAEATSVEEPIVKKIEEELEDSAPATSSEEVTVKEVEEKEEVVVSKEEKAVEAEVGGEGEEVHGEEEKIEGVPSSEAFTETPTETPSFKEESYNVGDLKEGEKKALEAFRLKVEEAIKSKSFFKKAKKKEEKAAPLVVGGGGEKKEGEGEDEEEKGGKVGGEEVVVVEAEAEAEESKGKEEEEATATTTTCVESVETTPIEEPKLEEPCPPAGVEEREVLIEETPAPPPPPIEGPKNFYLWGIPVHEGDEKTDVILLKFLRARNFKVEDAFSMLKSTISWRKEFNTDTILEEDLGPDFDSFAFVHGVDKEGHPVCYNYNVFQSKEFYGDKAKFSKFLRWRVQVMEKSIRALDFAPGGVNSIVQVIDLQNSPGFLKGVQAMKKFLSLLQDNYPELAAKQIILNMPWWYFPALYRVFRLEPKVVWAGPGKSTEALFKYISPNQVPVQYGGLSRPDDTEFQGVEAPVTELTIKAGDKRVIELPIEVGTTMVWDISIVGWDVVYGEEFIPETYTVIIRKPKKLAPSSDPIRNTFKAGEPGKVVLTIDNSVSKKKKIAVYRFTSKKTPS